MVAENPVRFRPLHGWVLAKQIPRTETPGGIALPDQAETGEPPKAKVVAVGPGEETLFGHRLEMPVKVGDVIYIQFPPGSMPGELVIGGTTYALFQAKHICGVVES